MKAITVLLLAALLIGCEESDDPGISQYTYSDEPGKIKPQVTQTTSSS